MSESTLLRTTGTIFLKILSFLIISIALSVGLVIFFPEALGELSWAEAFDARPTWMSLVLYGGMSLFCLVALGFGLKFFWGGIFMAGGLFLYAWKGIPLVAGFLYRHSVNLPLELVVEVGAEMQRHGFDVDPQMATDALGASFLGEMSRFCIINFGALGTAQLLFFLGVVVLSIWFYFFD